MKDPKKAAKKAAKKEARRRAMESFLAENKKVLKQTPKNERVRVAGILAPAFAHAYRVEAKRRQIPLAQLILRGLYREIGDPRDLPDYQEF